MTRKRHERSLVSHGNLDFYHVYHELISSQSELPYARFCSTRSVFDYTRFEKHPNLLSAFFVGKGAVQIFNLMLDEVSVVKITSSISQI